MNESGEQLSHVEKYELNFKESLSDAIELAQLTGVQVALDPNTLGLEEDKTIEDLTVFEKGAVGKAIWNHFEIPKGKKLLPKNSLFKESSYQAPEGSRVSGKIRERTFQTGIEGVLVHELLFADGQKRFTVSVG